MAAVDSKYRLICQLPNMHVTATMMPAMTVVAMPGLKIRGPVGRSRWGIRARMSVGAVLVIRGLRGSVHQKAQVAIQAVEVFFAAGV
jgi:hypothetical protein